MINTEVRKVPKSSIEMKTTSCLIGPNDITKPPRTKLRIMRFLMNAIRYFEKGGWHIMYSSSELLSISSGFPCPLGHSVPRPQNSGLERLWPQKYVVSTCAKHIFTSGLLVGSCF